MGEGSGALVLEEYEHASGARRDKSMQSLKAMAYRAMLIISPAPAPDGDGGYRAMKMAFK